MSRRAFTRVSSKMRPTRILDFFSVRKTGAGDPTGSLYENANSLLLNTLKC